MLYNSAELSLLNELTEVLLESENDVGLYVGGSSMYPHLRKGDYVHISKINFELLHPGDIIVFKGKEKYVAHRIIKKVSGLDFLYYITKGDSCKRADKAVTKENYFGKIVSFKRNGKKYHMGSRFFKNYNRFLAFISPYTPIIYSTLRFSIHLFKSFKNCIFVKHTKK